MEVTLTRLHDAGTARSETEMRTAQGRLSASSAPALYFAGALVETLGFALIAAYGLVLAGGVIAVCGLAVGTVANNRWPAAADGVSPFALVKSHLARPRHSRVD
jgi:hypothetical protein